jgi:UDP-N-acetylmuramate dehydrogenase
MEMTVFQQKLSALLPNIDLKLNESMARHTSFKIGGSAEVMAFPKSAEELSAVLKTSALLDVKPAILGAGTNVLAPDGGISGLVICLKDSLDGMEKLDGDRIRVAAGVTMTRAAVFAANLGLSGLEFAHGIPGTVGGGVYMNAGAYGGEIVQVCESVTVMDMAGNVTERTKEEMQFSISLNLMVKILSSMQIPHLGISLSHLMLTIKKQLLPFLLQLTTVLVRC